MNPTILFINSADRISGTTSNFKILFNNNLLKCNEDEIFSLTLNDFVCNYSFYNVASYRNKFRIIETTNIGTLQYDVEIPTGNYNVTELIIVVRNLINAQSNYIWTIGYIKAKNKMVFSYVENINTEVSPTVISFDVPEFQESAHEFLGFLHENYNVSLLSPLTSVGVVNVNAEEILYLRLEGIENNLGFSNRQFSISNVLGKISIQSTPFGKIGYINIKNNFQCLLTTKVISEMNFKLTNENEDEISTNLQEFTFSINVEKIKTKKEELTLKVLNDILIELKKLNEYNDLKLIGRKT